MAETTAASTNGPDAYVGDPYNYPDLPIEKRLFLAANPDLDETAVAGWHHEDGDGCREEITGLIADHDWHHQIAIANTMGLEGDWGVDDVHEAVTEALHEYRALRTENGRLREALGPMLAAAGQVGPYAQGIRVDECQDAVMAVNGETDV